MTQGSTERFTAPGPAPLDYPRVGRMTVLGTLRLLNTLRTRPLEVWSKYHFEEPIVAQKWAGGHTVLLNDPAAIKHCFVDNADNYRMEMVRQRVLKPFLQDGLLTAEGPTWRRSRRVLAPVFTPRSVRTFAEKMQRCSDTFGDKLATKQNRAVDVAEAMVQLTFDILSESLFSGNVGIGGEEIARAVENVLDGAGTPHPFDVLGAPRWLPRVGQRDVSGSIARMRAATSDAMDERQVQIDSGAHPPDDFLTLLLTAKAPDTGETLTRDEVIDNIVTFVGAGHETTARSLGWTLYLLSQSPGDMARVHDELDSVELGNLHPADWEQNLPFTRAVFEEGLRLYPPAVNLLRQANEPDEVGGVEIHKNSIVMVSAWVLHRHRSLWTNPDVFDPSRFLPEHRSTIDRFAYLPFGLGPRICIGAKFAMQEGVIALATLLKRFEFRYIGEKAPHPVLKVTLQPDNGLLMQVRERHTRQKAA